MALAPGPAHALPADPAIEQRRAQEREDLLRQRQERGVDVRLPAAPPGPESALPSGEVPCRRIDRIRLAGDEAARFAWLPEVAAHGAGPRDDPLGRCLGTQAIDRVLGRLQQALVRRGFVTTRVLVAPQDLSTGELVLTLVPGRLAGLRFDEASLGAAPERRAPTSLRAALPAREGELLDLRDVEQGLENLQRVPTAEADIRIEPATGAPARPGDSDLVVRYRQRRPLRALLSLDDSGTRATGRTQAGATMAWDNPLGLNDLAYLSLNHDAFNHAGQGTAGCTLHHSVPWGDWLLGFTGTRSRYHQRVAGLYESYVYSGESGQAEVKLARLLRRDQHGKTSATVRAFARSSRNHIDDTEIGVQHRITAGWELGLNHRQFIGDATLDASLAWRQGTGAFGAIAAPEEDFGEGTGRMRLATADIQLVQPLRLGGQRLRYGATWRAQWNRTPLTPQDRLAIGGRHTVRGFDGELSLMGERGWLWRNDLGWFLGDSGAEAYVGLDVGHVGGPASRWQLGDRLAGGVLGLRGAWGSLQYDVFVGAPIARPEGFQTARVTGGFHLNYGF